MQRCWLNGSDGDALRAVLCAAGFNIRWRLGAIARNGIAAFFFAFMALCLLGPWMSSPSSIDRWRRHQGLGA